MSHSQVEGISSDPIAIIGLSCRYPNANNPQEFWQLLVKGQDGAGPIPQDRIQKGIISRDYKYKVANYLNIPIDEFDSRFFEVSPKTATFMDPQLRLLLEVVWEALEESAIDPTILRGTTAGIFIGAWLQDYQKLAQLSPDKDFFLVYMGHAMSARIAFFLGTTGPSIDTESACSSSIAAVDLAFKSLRNKTCNLAVVGGANLIIEPPYPTDLDIGFATCENGRCKPFDSRADGYGRAEGCGVLILKRYSDAVRDGDNVLALIKGTALAQEGLSKSMGTPTVHSEALAMSSALKDANVDPSDVSYLEAHGTGTKVGDPIEIAAIAQVYSSKSRPSPLIIGTVKANVGHSEACSGITSIIKVVLSMQHQVIPKHVNFETLNPEINLEVIPAMLPLTNIPWLCRPGKPRIAGVNCFGISGTDGHVIIQEVPNKQSKIVYKTTERPLHLMKLSAKTGDALSQLIERYMEYLQNTSCNFQDIAFTANTGRALFNHRAVVISRDNLGALEKLKTGKYVRGIIASGREKQKVCMLFPGQGSQYPGMAEQLYANSPFFQAEFDKCCRILEDDYKIDLKSIMWSSGNHELLHKSINSPVAIFCTQYCIFQLWKHWGISPDYVLGHSLGESAAVVAVGVRDLESGLKALILKTRLVDELGKGKMIAVRLDQKKVRELLCDFLRKRPQQWLDIAAVNSPDQIVLSGESVTVEGFHEYCKLLNVKTIILASTHAFHSRMLDPSLDKIRNGLANIHSKLPALSSETNVIKYISSSEARIMNYQELRDENYWVSNTRNTVNFIEASQVALKEGCTLFIEVGSQPVLSSFVKSIDDTSSVVCLPSLRRNDNDWDTILNSLAQFAVTSRGDEINWKNFDESCNRKKVSLPFYPFIRKSYWIDKSKIINQTVSTEIHPLLGSRFQNASKTIIFQKELRLDQQSVSFLRDHVIGDFVIFPGAVFLEMCLAAFRTEHECIDPVQKSRHSVLIQDFEITSPLALSSDHSCSLQTTINTTTNGFQADVFHFQREIGENATGQWIHHCTASYFPENATKSYPVINVDHIRLKWEYFSSSMMAHLYEQLAQVGLRFGPTFQSMKEAWVDNNEQKAILVSIKLSDPSDDIYQMHPVVSDAMIQSSLLNIPKDALHVPVGIKRVTLVQPDMKFNQHDEYYVYITTCQNHDSNHDVFLLDRKGVVLACMEGLQMQATQLKLIEMNLKLNDDDMPKFWEESWKLQGLIDDYPTVIANDSEVKGFWLVFGQDTRLCELVKTELDRINRKYSIVEKISHVDPKEELGKISDTIEDFEGVLCLFGVSDDETNQQNLCKPLLHICQWFQQEAGTKLLPKLVIVTQSTQFVLETDIVMNPSPSTLWGIVKTLKNEIKNVDVKCVDLPRNISVEQQAESLFQEVFGSSKTSTTDALVAIRDGRRYVAKFVSVGIAKANFTLQKNEALFRHRLSCYMITGGLGGIGLKVAEWALEKGAKHLILVGRSAPNPEVAERIKFWNENGNNVYVYSADVGDLQQCSRLFNWLKESELPPLRGIFHCAGILADAIISNQTWENFEIALNPKVNGAWNLHTHSLHYQLDYFVMFSSISSTFGIPGQSNYAAGNSYEDALMRYRKSLGLASTSINWGNWEEVGMASGLQFPGLKPISVNQGLKALEYILRSNRRQLAVANFNSFLEFSKLCPSIAGYIEDRSLVHYRMDNNSGKNNGFSIITEAFWEEVLNACGCQERIEVFEKYITEVVKSILKVDQSELIDVHLEFYILGIDSLMLTELRSDLQNLFGKQLIISSFHIRDFSSIHKLAERLVNDWQGEINVD